MKEHLLNTDESLYKEKPCPICGKLFSSDWRSSYPITKVYLSPFAKHLADVHLSLVYDQIRNHPRELARLTVAQDPESWLAILYYFANYLGPRFVEKWISQAVDALRQHPEALEKMNPVNDRRTSL